MIKFGIVGLKNSGKTFFAQKLISYFTKKNFVVASIKHAHHTLKLINLALIVFFIVRLDHNKSLLVHQKDGLK